MVEVNYYYYYYFLVDFFSHILTHPQIFESTDLKIDFMVFIYIPHNYNQSMIN